MSVVRFRYCGPSICTGASRVLGSTDRDPGVRYFSYGAIWKTQVTARSVRQLKGTKIPAEFESRGLRW